MKTSELTGAQLDWAVAKCEGYTDLHKIEGRMPHEPQLGMFPPRREYGVMDLWELSFSSDWNKGGWIIEREGISLEYDGLGTWVAWLHHEDKEYGGVMRSEGQDTTPLIAAMRCYVASKLGDEVELPEGL
jgi:hypothetical protein